MAETLTEGGLRDHRTDFAPETTAGSIEAGGTYEPFSDEVTGVTWAPDGQIDARRGLGNVDPFGHDRGPETHELTTTFRLQGTIEATTPVYDAFARDADGQIHNTYTIVDREKFHNGGTQGTGYRVYTVGTGAKPASCPIPGDPGDGMPAEVEIPYTAEKVRSYRIDQPLAASSTLAVDGASASVVLQDDNGATYSTTHTGTGTTTVTWTGTYIDAFYLENDATSAVNLYDHDGTSPTAKLSTIYGSDKYDGIEGDLGVPYSGSRATSYQHGTEFQNLVGDTNQWGGNDLAFGISSVELSVDNSLETTPRQGKKRQRVFAGNRTVQLTATVYGKNESHDSIMDHLQNKSGTVTWNMTSNTVVVQGASLIDTGDRNFESGQAFMELDNTFEGTGIQINGTTV